MYLPVNGALVKIEKRDGRQLKMLYQVGRGPAEQRCGLRMKALMRDLGTRLECRHRVFVRTGKTLWKCSDPCFESDPSNEYSLLRLTHVMNSIFLDPSDEFLTQVVNIGIPKHTLGFCFHVSKRGYKIGYELTREEILLEAAIALTSYRGNGRGWQE